MRQRAGKIAAMGLGLVVLAAWAPGCVVSDSGYFREIPVNDNDLGAPPSDMDNTSADMGGSGADMPASEDMGAAAHVGRAGFFGADVQEVTLEVDYQTGAEPYVQRGALDPSSPWAITRANLEALCANRPRTLTLPSTLADMQQLALPDGSDQDFSTDELLAISAQNRDVSATSARRTLHVMFLDGYYADDSGRRANVLGVSIGDTGVIAMFKPVIASTGSSRVLIEQTTLVHEIGHAVGLVNNGVSMTTAHQDEPNGRHCTNRDCIMYYLNESAEDVGSFVGRLLLGGGDSEVLFGQECLDDTRAAAP